MRLPPRPWHHQIARTPVEEKLDILHRAEHAVGLAEATQDDHEAVERGIAIFDGLYTVLKRKT